MNQIYFLSFEHFHKIDKWIDFVGYPLAKYKPSRSSKENEIKENFHKTKEKKKNSSINGLWK